ncbi:MAG TPA: aminoglycoside phosphotransferase family protein [Polyangiaceae bacterium]
MARKWQLELGPAYENSTNALVLFARRPNGGRVVLKLPFLYEHNQHEADALEHYRGQGAVRLEAIDHETGALLLEHVAPGTPLGACTADSEIVAIGCKLLRRLWRQVTEPHPFRSSIALAETWALELSSGLERHADHFRADFATDALAASKLLCAPSVNEVLVNHDLHLENVLAAEREPWLLIDPKPLVGDPALDAGQFALQCLSRETRTMAAHDLATKLSRDLAVDRERLIGWAMSCALRNALTALDAGHGAHEQIELARQFHQAF